MKRETTLSLLAGNSLDNKNWLIEIEKAMEPHFEKIIRHEYHHWQIGKRIMDFDHELKALSERLREEKNYLIFAKSAGAVLCLKGVYEKLIAPKKCVFVGFPLFWAKDFVPKFSEYVKNFSIPTIFVQHDNDPAASSAELKNFLKESQVRDYAVVEWLAASHYYPELEALAKLTADFADEKPRNEIRGF